MVLNISDLVKRYEAKGSPEKDQSPEERARKYLTQHEKSIKEETADFTEALNGATYRDPKSEAGIENKRMMEGIVEQNRLALIFLAGENTRITRVATAHVLDRYAERALTHAKGWDEDEKARKTSLSQEDAAALQRAEMIKTAQELRNIII